MAVIIGLIGSAIVALQTPPARRFVLDKATTLLAQQNISFSTSDFSYNLLDLSTELRNVRIQSSALADAPPFIEIDRARVDLSSWQVLRGRYVIESAEADGVRVHFFVNEQGVNNLPRPVTDPDKPSQPIDYLIADLKAPDAAIRYEDRARQIDLTIPRASLTVEGDALTNRHDVSLEAAGGDARYREQRAHLDRLAATLDLGREDVKINRAELEAEGALINASGSYGPFDDPIADLAVQATADIARAAGVARVKEPVSGRISIEGSVKGPIDAVVIDGQVRGDDVRVRELNHLTVDTAAAYQVGEDVLTVSRLHVTGPMGAVRGDGVVAIRGTRPSRVKAAIEGLRAEPVMQALRLPYRVATRVDGTVDAEWPGLDYARATGSARVSLTPTASVASRSTLPLAGRLVVAGQGDRVTATLSAIRAAGVDLNGRVVIRDRDRIDGSLRAHAANVQTTAAAIEAFLGNRRGTLLPMPILGSVTAEGRLGGRLTAPALVAAVDAPALSIGGASGIAIDADLSYRSDVFGIDRLDMAWQSATAHANGTIGLRGRRSLDLDLRADALQIPGLLELIERGDVPASGIVSARGRVAGTVASPQASFQITASELVAYNESLGTLSAAGRFAQRRVDVTTLGLDKPQPDGNGRLAGSGTYELGSKRFALNLRSQNLKLLSLTLPDGRRVTGAIDLTADGRGTVADPAGTIQLRADDLVFGEYAIGRVTADTTLAQGAATTTTTAERLALTAKSTISASRPFQATLSATVDDLNLGALPVKLQTPLDGVLRARVEASGPLSDPRSGRADATVETFAGTWQQRPFRLDGPARLRYADERLAIDELRLAAQDSTIAVTGNLPLLDTAAPGAITIDAKANLATLAQYAPAASEIAADGRLTVTGTLAGTLRAIDPNLLIQLSDALVLSPRFEPGISNLNVTASVSNGEATVNQLTANWGNAQIEVSARVPLDLLPQLPVEVPRKSGPVSVRARVDNLSPGAIPGAPQGLSGKISLDAEVEAAQPNLRDARGKVAFRDLQLGFEGLTLEQKAPSTLALRDGVAAIESLALAGSVGNLSATGTVGLVGERPIDLNIDGGLNIAAVSLVTDRVRAEGASVIDVAATGTIADPILSGNVAVTDGTLVVDEPRIAAEAVNARLDLTQNRINLSTLTATVNGGALQATGGMAIRDGSIADLDVRATLRDFAYDAPLDLRSLSDSDVRITSKGDDILVNGQVTIQEAGLTGDINFDTGLLATITARRQLELTPERNPLLERVLFNIDVDTATPILVDNNLAKAEINTDLRVVGTPYETGLLGRLDVVEGGVVTLNERTYEIDRGEMTFVDDRRIVPSFNLAMNTAANNYDITMTVTGEPGNTETTLTSSPSLPEPDIMAMLVTGRTLDEMRGEEYDVAREQLFSYLTGRVGSTLGRQLQAATGFSQVRLEPQLIANEANPGARLTLGQDLTDDLTLTYSVDLADSDDQIWVATYDVTRRFQTRAVRQADNSYRVDFRHDVRKGGAPEPRRQPRIRPTVTSVTVPADAPIPQDQLVRMFDAEAGRPLDYFAVRNSMEDIEQRLREAGWAQSRVRLARSTEEGGVKLALGITRGPQVEFTYSGMTPPAKVQDEVRLQWHRGVFDAQRTDDAAETLREWLMRDNYLQNKVEFRVDDSNPERRLVQFTIEPGPRSRTVLLEFKGASGISPDELDQVIDQQKLERQLFTDPTVVTELLQRLYREQGYLNAEIDKPRFEFAGDTARVILDIREGPQFTVSGVTVRGNAALTEPELLADMPVVAGEPFVPVAAENALQHLRGLYWAKGYNEVRPAYQLTIDRVGGRAGVAFTINEGRQAIVSEIRIAGNDKTSERLVREQLIVQPNEPLNLQALSRSRKNLYDSGAFSLVDVTRDPVTEDADAALVGALAAPSQQPVLIDVAVREVQPYQIRYGASYDTERQAGVVFDASLHNILGKARVLGLASRYDRQLREGRLYLTQPTLLHWPIQTTASIYYQEERNPATQVTDAFYVDRRGASIQQERRLKDAYVWTYGYRFERAHTFDPLGLAPAQFIKVAPLSSAFVRDVRDDVLDATRGSFSSHALSYSPTWLGSDDTYLKYFGQYFHYIPLQRAQRKRFSNEIIRPRFVFATAVRVGLSKGMGAFVPTTERFFAGGSTTLRGFEQNAVGPVAPGGVPIGGDAMLVLNNELRFPLISLIDGVGFLDVGNVWQGVHNFSLGDLRETAGVGLRLRTKWVLVRGDYGLVLDRRAGERRGRFYFSIGQAF